MPAPRIPKKSEPRVSRESCRTPAVIAGVLHDWGREASTHQLSQLARLGIWIREEAMPGGGVGASDAERVEERHLLDSLAFLQGIVAVPGRLVDGGSGVGLPGIPLAIMLPGTEVLLVDRSERRCRLARRAIRILGVDNAMVIQDDVGGQEADVVTMRAVMDPAKAATLIDSKFPGARGVIALTRGGPCPEPGLPVLGSHLAKVIDGGLGILDPAPWILIMATL